MTIRTKISEVTFTAPFRLPGFRAPAPAGTYKVEVDEEAIEGNDRTVYRRVATLLIMQEGASTRSIAVQPHDLAAALERDRVGALNASTLQP